MYKAKIPDGCFAALKCKDVRLSFQSLLKEDSGFF